MNKNIILLVIVIILGIILVSTFYIRRLPYEQEEIEEEKPEETPEETPEEKPSVTNKTVTTLERRINEIFTNGWGKPSYKPQVPKYDLPVDLSKVIGYSELGLSEEDMEKLSKNGFIVIEGGVTDLADVYDYIQESGRPVYVTTDAVLYTYHAIFDNLLADLEEEKFTGILQELLRKMLEYSMQMDSQDEDIKEAIKRNNAFLMIALRLIDPTYSPPSEYSSIVEKEIDLINSASAPQTRSPIFEYNEDYTQYRPRGHYTRSEKLKRYFKCMMWLGRMRFEYYDRDDPSLAIRQTRQALLLTYIMYYYKTTQGEPLVTMWEKIYLPTAFIVGVSDDLTFYDYYEVMQEVYGSEFSISKLADLDKLKIVQEKLGERDKSKIVSSPASPHEFSELGGLRFMGQRFILDGYVHQLACYPNVPTRFMVSGLDIMYALGSERAGELLEDEFKEHDKLKEKLDYAREYIRNMSIDEWRSTLYNGWLYTLIPLLQPIGEGYPSYMQTKAWLDKSLNTALSSWAQLRHDTILYAKQPYAGLTAVPPEAKHVGYVEPYPEVYLRLRNLALATINGLSSMDLLSDGWRERLEDLADLLDKLAVISIKELENRELTEEEEAVIKYFGGRIERILAYEKLQYKDPRIIADVYTDPNSNMVLEVGTGYFDHIIVVYPDNKGKLYFGYGLVMSYYEFPWPQSDRLTDEKWRSMLEGEERPKQPEWMCSFKSC